MSKEDFVSFEQARRLKKLGFNEPCYYHYDIKVNVVYPIENILKISSPNTVISSNHLARTNIEFSDRYVFAPTLSQACKWLREKHNIHIQIESVVGKRWTYDVVDINPIQDISGEYISRIPERDGYPVTDTYEQAQSAGIDVALGLLERERTE